MRLTEHTALHAEVETRLRKVARADLAALNLNVDMFLSVGDKLGYRFKADDKVLDLGCGLGDTVMILLDRGADAFGVDIMEFWGKDYESYWKVSPLPSQHVAKRLRVADPARYEIPFADNFFDFCISSQVFEHVFDYHAVFAELGRVLKPGALSLHLFPGPWSPVEAHVNVPVIPLCRYKWWLALWALTGRRSERQDGMPWREVLETNALNMQNNNYPPRRVLREAARACGMQIKFAEGAYIQSSRSRPNTIMRYFDAKGLGWAVAPFLETLSQRMMVLWKTRSA